MKKKKAENLLKDLRNLDVMPSDANIIVSKEIEKQLEENLQKKEEKNKKEFLKYKMDFSIYLKKEQLELSLANFTF